MALSPEEQGQVLREFRVAAWMTTADVGEALGGYKAQTVTAWEMGRNKPSRQILIRLADVWQVPLALLLHELGDPVELPLVDGQPLTFGRWIDGVRAKRREGGAAQVKHNVNRFAPTNGALPVLALSSRDGLLERVG